jgi:hypothetical protein
MWDADRELVSGRGFSLRDLGLVPGTLNPIDPRERAPRKAPLDYLAPDWFGASGL